MKALHYLNQLKIHDHNSYTHSIRVGYLACFLRAHYKLSKDFVYAAFFHDIGKLYIPSRILSKKERLTDSEYALIKLHPKLGYQLLAEGECSVYTRNLVLMHHEKYVGGGYPDGQVDTQLESNLLTLIDSYDAINAARSYSNAVPQQEVLSILQKSIDIQFSQTAYTMFIAFLSTIDCSVLDDSVVTLPSQQWETLKTEKDIMCPIVSHAE